MPVISSPRRYSTTAASTTASSYLPPAIGGTTTHRYSGSYSSSDSYQRSTNSYLSSSYRSSGHDTSPSSSCYSNRFGVSSTRYSSLSSASNRGSLDRESFRKSLSSYSSLNDRGYLSGGKSSSLEKESNRKSLAGIDSYRDRYNRRSCIALDSGNKNTSGYDTLPITKSKYSSSTRHESSPLSSSSLARTVALAGVDLFEKYSPAHYIPKCELSRSRSLSDATTPNDQAELKTTTGRKPIKDYSEKEDEDTNSKENGTTSMLATKIRNTSIRSGLPPSSAAATNRYSRLISETEAPSKSNNYGRRNSTEESDDGLCGLRNIGNTCFMNSVLQCLSHTNELMRYMKTHANGLRTTTKDQRILAEFAKLIRDMWTPNNRSVTPMEFKSAFSSKYRMYSGSAQQDAQEFLRFFLDALHCALNTGTKGEHLQIDDSLSDNKKADLTWEWYSKSENSVIKDLFVGQLKSTLRCTTCGNTSVTFDPFWDLSVSLPSSSRCKLDSCLELFIREEILDGDEMPTCSKCKQRRKCTKSFTIQRFPKYLVIHLKRFSETRWSKMTNIVEFPTGERELNMAPYASNSSSPVLYTLYGISNHMGSTAGGHYVALCKHPINRKWHEFNDNVVSASSGGDSLVSSSAYLLFYERA